MINYSKKKNLFKVEQCPEQLYIIYLFILLIRSQNII